MRSVDELIARAQLLIDEPLPVSGHPLAWDVEALHLGDLPAIVAETLHERDFAERPRRRT